MSLDEDKRGRRAAKAADDSDLGELEKRVHLAELHAREAEAEVRYLEATQKRKQLRVSRTGHAGSKKEGRRLRRPDREEGGGDDDE
jgi:hypothetical protein